MNCVFFVYIHVSVKQVSHFKAPCMPVFISFNNGIKSSSELTSFHINTSVSLL